MIKCLLLKTGITVVSEMLEVGAEVGEPDCRLVNPCEITAVSYTHLTLPTICSV